MSLTPNRVDQLLELLCARHGHFVFESGYHGSLWLDIPRLFDNPARLMPLVRELAAAISPLQPEVICGPGVEGALLAYQVAEHLGASFCFTERRESETIHGSPMLVTDPCVNYSLSPSNGNRVNSRRVVIIDDIINAGSAVYSTWNALQSAGAEVVGCGALLILGNTFEQELPARHSARGLLPLPIITLGRHPIDLWHADRCPVCRQQIENLTSFGL